MVLTLSRQFVTLTGTGKAVRVFFPARQGAEGSSRYSDRNISLFPSWSGQGLISTPIYYHHRTV